MTKPKTRRRRALACHACRQKKLRCDRQQPCTNCTRSKNPNNVCAYAEGPVAAAPAPSPPLPSGVPSGGGSVTVGGGGGEGPALYGKRRRVDGPDSAEHVSISPGGAVGAAPVMSDYPEGPLSIRHQPPLTQKWHSSDFGSVLVDPQLSASPSGQVTTTAPSTTAIATDRLAADKNQSTFGHMVGNLSDPIRAFMVRTRYISPSSWLYSILLVPPSLIWLEQLKLDTSESRKIVNACKVLSKRLQDHQVLQWAYGEYGKFLPYRAMSDVLVDNYLRTFETVYRVLHVPTFRADYDRLWQQNDIHGSNNHKLNGFIVQVQLCCALGALLYDEGLSLRAQALQWTREASAWLETPAKTLLEVPNIQTMCLHMLAYESLHGPWGDRVWLLSGTVTRAAMLVGLHRDPTKLPGISRDQAEMRRRLWLTVLELTLGSCLDPGAAPLLSLDDSDCALPANFDDAQLDIKAESSDTENQSVPVPKDMDQYTDTSLQIILGRTLAARLAVARFATNLKAHDYQEALQLSERYGAACRELSDSLRTLRPRLSEFQRQYCEMTMARFTFTLHIPYMVVGTKHPAAYMLSRKACVDAAVGLLHSCFSLSSMAQEPLLAAVHQTMNLNNGASVDAVQRDDFVRLCITGSGPCRSAPFQALMVIAAELTALADENRSSIRWSSDMRALELLSLLRVATDWTKRRVRAGHESNKDHTFIVTSLASIEALMKGEPVEEAVEARGKEACLEEKAIIEGLIPTGDASWESVPSEEWSSPGYDLLADHEMWLMQASNFVDFDFMNGNL